MRVADYLIKFLQERGVDHAFLVAGGQMMYLMDAVKQSGMKYTCFHHEQAAAYAADAYARVTGRPSLCLATGGPGGPNLLTGIVGAFQDSVPVIFLVGQSKRKDMSMFQGNLRQKGFLEVNTLPMALPYTKYTDVVDQAEQVGVIARNLWDHCRSGRPGPVYVEVPLDVQGAEVNLSTDLETRRTEPECHPDDYRKVVDAMSKSERPVLLLGRGVDEESARLIVDRLYIPTLTTQFAKSLVGFYDPSFMDHPGVKGDTAANLILSQADFVLVLGCSLHNQTVGWDGEYLPKDAKIFHVDPDRAVLNKTKGTTKIVSDVGRFIAGFIPLVGAGCPMEWETTCYHVSNAHANEYRTWETAAEHDLDLYQVLTELDEALPNDAIVIYDAGQPYYAVPQVLRKRGTQRFIAPGSLASMGWALPAAIGASKATDRPIYAIIGDGSLMTNVQELATLALHGGRVTLIVIENGGYASIRNTQERYCDGRMMGSHCLDAWIPDIRNIASCFGINYVFYHRGHTSHHMEWPICNCTCPQIIEVACRDDQQILLPKVMP